MHKSAPEYLKIIKYLQKGPAGKKIHSFQLELIQKWQSMFEISGYINKKKKDSL